MKGTKTQEDKDKKGRHVVHDSSETMTQRRCDVTDLIQQLAITGTREMFIDRGCDVFMFWVVPYSLFLSRTLFLHQVISDASPDLLTQFT